ncbi:MAG TPA: hypothetical protein VFL55_21115 [Acetobacteraceae bacterium]|nr:hypothetical protein [Acetobacteraceae bacterium]
MFPLLAIGGVIGAVVSAAKGASWLADQLDPTKNAASAGGKSETKPATDAKATSFEATLAAQVAGQTVPASAPSPAAQVANVTAAQHGTDYDALGRMKAGMFAYSHVGEHHGHQKSAPQGSDAPTVARS